MQTSSRDNTIGIAVALGLHVLILMALFFIAISVTVPDPPLKKGGMEIDFGMSDEGSGNDELAIPTGPVVSNNPSMTPTPVRTSPQTAEEIMSSEKSDEVVAMPKPNKNPVQENVKPVEAPKPKINQGALMPGKTSTGGQGNSNMPGNQGRLDGVPGGQGQGGSGNNPYGNGHGDGKGVKIDLAGRNRVTVPSFTYSEQEDGIVVVKITVNRNGKVVNATTEGVRGSTTTNKTLHNLAIDNAKKTTFNVKADAPPEQIGYMTFYFERR